MLWAHTPYLNLFTVFNRVYSLLCIPTFFTSLSSQVFWLLHHYNRQTIHTSQSPPTVNRTVGSVLSLFSGCSLRYVPLFPFLQLSTLRTFWKHLSLSFPFKNGLATGCMTSGITKVCGTADLPGNVATFCYIIFCNSHYLFCCAQW
jgi:hypothetical protein